MIGLVRREGRVGKRVIQRGTQLAVLALHLCLSNGIETRQGERVGSLAGLRRPVGNTFLCRSYNRVATLLFMRLLSRSTS